MKTISAALLAKQSVSGVDSYVKCVFKTKAGVTLLDASTSNDRLYDLEHHEEPYNEYATITLKNYDLAIGSGSGKISLVGSYVDIAYGYTTGNAVAEPNGDNSTHEYAYTPRLWVRNQHVISTQGHLLCVLELGGVWSIMQEQMLRVGNPPLYQDEESELVGKTIYDILEAIIETELATATGYAFTLAALGSADDGIINTYEPSVEMNSVPYESIARVVQILLAMTCCYIRPKPFLDFELVYPKSSDPTDETYYSDQIHYFSESEDVSQLVTPNHVIVFCNSGADGEWTNYIAGEAFNPNDFSSPPTYDGDYMEVIGLYKAETIDNQTDANNRATAIMSKAVAEQFGGHLVIPMDVRVEMFDRPAVFDVRGE